MSRGGGGSQPFVTARASARVDLAGGSLDLWPIGQLVPGASTVNVAVSLTATVACFNTHEPGVRLSSLDLAEDYLWQPGSPPGALALLERLCEFYGVTAGLRLEASSTIPPGSGLGGSSALTVATALALQAITGKTAEAADTVALCRDVEAAHLRIPTGVQDFWPPLVGGVLRLRYRPGEATVESLPVSLQDLAKRLVVVYSGQSRLSADTNWALLKRFLDGDLEVARALRGVAEVADRMASALSSGDLDGAGTLLDAEWEHRKALAEGVSTPTLELLLREGRKAGALGGKACGAGGGGCLAFLTREGARWELERALEEQGARILPAHPIARGHTVETTR